MQDYKWLCGLLNQIDELTSRAWNSISELESLHFEPRIEDERIYQEELLKKIIEEIDIKIVFALDSLQLSNLVEKYNTDFRKFKESLDSIDLHWYGDYFFSPALEFQTTYIQTLRCYCDLKDQDIFRIILERILRGTPKIIFDKGLIPSNEKEIKDSVYNILIHSFPDTVPETSISKVTKCYKPDFGIKSLKSVIEYKFADTKTEAKKILGEIYTDIHGYDGSEDWKYFYAVLYMSKPFFTEPQILSEFDIAKVNHSWIPIIVHGTGGRKRKNVQISKQKHRKKITRRK